MLKVGRLVKLNKVTKLLPERHFAKTNLQQFLTSYTSVIVDDFRYHTSAGDHDRMLLDSLGWSATSCVLLINENSLLPIHQRFSPTPHFG